MPEKNVGAIDKIISEKSERDFHAKWDTLTSKQHYDYSIGKLHDQFFYTLGSDTLESISVKQDYLDGKISEEEYKSYVLKVRLLDE